MILDLNDENQELTEEQQKLKDVIKSTIDTYLEKKGIDSTESPQSYKVWRKRLIKEEKG